METPSSVTLHRLSDTGLVLAHRDEDIRGRKVVDAAGEEIGEVDDLLIDDAEKKVRFLRVAAGGFLGLGERKFLIPVDAVTRITGETVHIDRHRDHVAGSPAYDPEVVPLDQRYLDTVYGYYGFGPYWGAGYVYPPYPYFAP